MKTQQAQKLAKSHRRQQRQREYTDTILLLYAKAHRYMPGSWLDRKLKERNLKP